MRVAPRVVQGSLSSSPIKFTVAHRLLRKDGFDRAMHAESLADQHFKVFFVRNGGNNAKLGIIVSKRTLSGAADRNRIKRIIRETFRQHSIKVREIDLVVMLRRDCSQKQADLANDLKTLFNRVESRCAEL
jgi:ribonuclease P protein component